LIAIIAILAVSIISQAYQTVPAGYVGVVLQWGNPVRTTGSGLQTITPFVESMAFVNVQVQSATAQEGAASSDLQEVSTSVTVNYQLDQAFAKEIYINLRDQYANRVIIPAMQDALKASTAKYQATNLITQREDAKQTFQNLLQDKLTQYHIIITSISITDFQFSPSFTTAIEAKVTAEQNALAAQNQLQVVNFTAQQQIIQATANATALILQAQGQANATIISANATATQIQLINAQLASSPEFIQYLYAKGWDGKLPIYWSSGNSTAPFLLLPTQQTP
jgi:regulator of protease activity HflC (stomatin/prohibitin superfamily)